MTVALLSFANYGHWIAFGSITKSAAKYYDQTGNRVDLITVISYSMAMPFNIIATYAVEKWGLKFGLKLGGILNGIGKEVQGLIIRS